MINFIKKCLGIEQKAPEKSFFEFFNTASSEERVSLLRRVAREANEDQKKLMEEAERTLAKKAART